MRRSFFCLVLSALIAAVLSSLSAVAADPPGKIAATKTALARLAEGDKLADRKDYDGAVLRYKDAYEELVAELRGLKFKQPVTPKLMTRPELQKQMVKMVAEDYTEKELYEMDRGLKALRLAPANLDVKKTLTDLLTEEVGGFYNPKNKEMVLIREAESKHKKGLIDFFFGTSDFDKDETKVTLAHEMVHALQDQHFDLMAMDKAVEGDDDMSMALTAVIEGEATLVMFAEMLRDSGDARDVLKMPPSRMDLTFSVLKSLTPFASGKTFQNSPMILRESLIFPYHKGTVFVLHLTNKSEWKLVDEAFRDPPTSTEQILHPEKYYDKRDEPQRIELPDLAAVLGKEWKSAGTNVLGEFQTAVLLSDSKGADRKAAQAAAAGWDGDRYAVFENAKKELGLVWLTTWDTANDAKEFAKGYAAHLAKKLPTERDDFVYRIETRGQDVAVIEGFAAAEAGKLADVVFTAKKAPKKFILPKKSAK